MKKAILAALLTGSAVLASCTKEATQTQPPKTRFFSYEMASGSMYQTRSVTSDAVLSIINDALPETVACNFSGEKNFVVKTGEYSEIPSGTYSVSGTYIGKTVGGMLSQDLGAVTLSPAVKINQTLTVTDEETNYTLSGTYFCFAIVWDATEVERIEFTDAYGKTYEMPSLENGNTRLAFVQGELINNFLCMSVYPVDTENYQTSEYTIATRTGNGLDYAEFGKWYMVSPSLGGNQPKWLGLELPDFVQGEF